MNGFLECNSDRKEVVYTTEECNNGKFCEFDYEDGDDFTCYGCGGRMKRDGFFIVSLETIKVARTEETVRLSKEADELRNDGF